MYKTKDLRRPDLDIEPFLYLSEPDADLVDIGALGIGRGEPDGFEVVSLRVVDGVDDIVCIGIYIGDGGGFVGLIIVEFDDVALVEVGDDLCRNGEQGTFGMVVMFHGYSKFLASIAWEC